MIAALTRGTVVVEAAVPQRLAGHRARSAQRLGPVHDGRARARSPAGSRPGCTNCCAAEAVLVTDAAEVVELVGDIGELAPDRRGPGAAAGPAGPVDARGCWTRCRRAAPPAARHRPRRRHHADEALGRLYELHSLGFVERHGDGWQLTATPRARGRRAARRSLTWSIRVKG